MFIYFPSIWKMGQDRVEGLTPRLTRGTSETCVQDTWQGEETSLTHKHAKSPSFCYAELVRYGAGITATELLVGLAGTCELWRRQEGRVFAALWHLCWRSRAISFRAPLGFPSATQLFHHEWVITASTKEKALQIAPNWRLSSSRVENTFLRSKFL